MQGVERFLRILFCIIFRLELEQDISEVCAKFERISSARFKFGYARIEYRINSNKRRGAY